MTVLDLDAARIRKSLKALVSHLEIGIGEANLIKGKKVLWLLPYPDRPEIRDILTIVENSEQEASLNMLGALLREANASLNPMFPNAKK